MRRLTAQLGELQCRVLDALPAGASPSLAVVLCHGFGAPADDLVSLAPELLHLQPGLAARVRFVFPAAPLSLAQLGMPGARAWWHLPMELLTRQLRDWELFAQSVPEGLPAARRAVMGVVQALGREWGLAPGHIVLGGFSQGGMAATDVALRLEEPPAGLCILSGTLVSRDDWQQRAARRAGLPVFMAHGRLDDVLPFGPAERLRDLLKDAGLAVDFVPFDGPHGIDAEALERLGRWLVARLPRRPEGGGA